MVSDHGPPYMILIFLMGPKFNSNTKRSKEGRFHEDMDEKDEKDEFKNFVRNMLKIF